MTATCTPCVFPSLLHCHILDTSFRQTNQCRTSFSAPIFRPRPVFSSHSGACQSTPHWFFLRSKAWNGSSQTPSFNSSHSCLATYFPCLVSEAKTSRPAGKLLTCRFWRLLDLVNRTPSHVTFSCVSQHTFQCRTRDIGSRRLSASRHPCFMRSGCFDSLRLSILHSSPSLSSSFSFS